MFLHIQMNSTHLRYLFDTEKVTLVSCYKLGKNFMFCFLLLNLGLLSGRVTFCSQVANDVGHANHIYFSIITALESHLFSKALKVYPFQHLTTSINYRAKVVSFFVPSFILLAVSLWLGVNKIIRISQRKVESHSYYPRLLWLI